MAFPGSKQRNSILRMIIALTTVSSLKTSLKLFRDKNEISVLCGTLIGIAPILSLFYAAQNTPNGQKDFKLRISVVRMSYINATKRAPAAQTVHVLQACQHYLSAYPRKMTDDDFAVRTLRSYLRIPSIQPNVDYTECVQFLTAYTTRFNLATTVYEFIQDKPIVLVFITGQRPEMGTILLNSHMDVVAVSPENWHHDPFGAEMDADGNIYARGTQDTKSLGIQYLEAMRRLQANKQTFLRNVAISFVPDEEQGGDGMRSFVETEEFKKLNVVFTIDEGTANPGPEFFVMNGEKAAWHVEFKIRGTEGHGSADLRDTAGEKLQRILEQAMDYRQEQLQQIDSDPNKTVSDVTFLNVTQVTGGSAPNVVPPEMSITFDIRVAVNDDMDALSKRLQDWATNAGKDVTVNYILKDPASPVTPVDSSNEFWTAMKKELDSLNQAVIVKYMAGATDSRFLRRKGIFCIDFSPMNNTPSLAHANDEFINKDVFLRGIQIFMKIIPALTNSPSLASRPSVDQIKFERRYTLVL